MKFELTENEERAYKEFYKQHKNCCDTFLGKPFFSTTGGQFTFIITPTGLGLIISVKCNVCGKIKDITDNNW